MPVIHIETLPVGRGEFEFIQTWVDGLDNLDERVFIEKHEDRMYGAMVNVGYACRWFVENQTVRGVVCITTDTDGKDVRYGGEHNALFEAIHSRNEYLKYRSKYALLYGRYVAFLDRIRYLADSHEIDFTQNNDVVIDIKQKGAEFKDVGADTVTNKKQVWTRSNIIRITLSGKLNRVTCNACAKSSMYQQSDNFVPFSDTDVKGHRVLIKSNKHLVKNFMEKHLALHTN